MTRQLVHVICEQDSECNLNPLPDTPTYSLSKLEKETVDLVELGLYEYFLVKILTTIWQAVSFIGNCGGVITAISHVKRTKSLF